MEVERSEDLCFYTLCVVRSPAAESTVNLRCPVAINDRTRRAVQILCFQTHSSSCSGLCPADKCLGLPGRGGS